MIRRTKQEVLTELGEKYRYVRMRRLNGLIVFCVTVKLCLIIRETVLLDPALIWTNDDIGENMKTYATDFTKMKGRDKDDVLLKFYNETAHAKKTAVW